MEAFLLEERDGQSAFIPTEPFASEGVGAEAGASGSGMCADGQSHTFIPIRPFESPLLQESEGDDAIRNTSIASSDSELATPTRTVSFQNEKGSGSQHQLDTPKGLYEKYVGGSIRINIIDARHLTSKDKDGYSDPFVVLTFGNSVAKTVVHYNSLLPQFNEGFDFPINSTKLPPIDIAVWDRDAITNELIGRIVLYPDDICDFREYENNDPQDKIWYSIYDPKRPDEVSGKLGMCVFVREPPPFAQFLDPSTPTFSTSKRGKKRRTNICGVTLICEKVDKTIISNIEKINAESKLVKYGDFGGQYKIREPLDYFLRARITEVENIGSSSVLGLFKGGFNLKNRSLVLDIKVTSRENEIHYFERSNYKHESGEEKNSTFNHEFVCPLRADSYKATIKVKYVPQKADDASDDDINRNDSSIFGGDNDNHYAQKYRLVKKRGLAESTVGKVVLRISTCDVIDDLMAMQKPRVLESGEGRKASATVIGCLALAPRFDKEGSHTERSFGRHFGVANLLPHAKNASYFIEISFGKVKLKTQIVPHFDSNSISQNDKGVTYDVTWGTLFDVVITPALMKTSMIGFNLLQHHTFSNTSIGAAEIDCSNIEMICANDKPQDVELSSLPVRYKQHRYTKIPKNTHIDIRACFFNAADDHDWSQWVKTSKAQRKLSQEFGEDSSESSPVLGSLAFSVISAHSLGGVTKKSIDYSAYAVVMFEGQAHKTKTQTSNSPRWIVGKGGVAGSRLFKVHDVSSHIDIVVLDEKDKSEKDPIIGRACLRLCSIQASPSDADPTIIQLDLQSPCKDHYSEFAGTVYVSVKLTWTVGLLQIIRSYLKPVGQSEDQKCVEDALAVHEETFRIKRSVYNNIVRDASSKFDPSLQVARVNISRIMMMKSVLKSFEESFRALSRWENPYRSLAFNISWVYICVFPSKFIGIWFAVLGIRVAYSGYRTFVCGDVFGDHLFMRLRRRKENQRSDEARERQLEKLSKSRRRSKGPFSKLKADYRNAKNMIIKTQENIGYVAAVLEGVINLFSWVDPKLSGSLAFFGLSLGIIILYFVPINIILLFGGLFMF
eukprot:UC4_evm11s1290